ncbi:family 43 glycosylhydrolase [Pedobacter sp. JY14-1]|uniref:family 43 glycosylhydrolase n=1 Tax=Pedobacter sp. JY14-1 TaxID=3034151 RepID=UPI0023E0FCC7|nr:family 43 glycosylhydrolase [Pedobacter sp. JY14-1]
MKASFKLPAFALVLQLLFVFSSVGQSPVRPVIGGDFADPSVIRKGNQYYAVGTSSEWAPHFPIYTSGNLKDWKQVGYVFEKAPEWTSGSFWAPEYYFHNNTYYIYYTARRKKDGVSYIGVATSRYPDRDFKDHGVIIEHGKEAIDAFVFNDNGQLYISFKAYGLDSRPIEILGSKLSADGLKLEGETFTMFRDDKRLGLEGQSILKRNGYYYLFYSAGSCCGSQCDYNVRVARSREFKGPYEDFSENPLLQGSADWKCSGHGTFVTTADGRTAYLHHAYHKQTTVYTGREGLLADLSWSANDWPVLKEVSGTADVVKNIKDDFKGKAPAKYWQWDFRNSTPSLKQSAGRLYVSGAIKADNPSGIAVTVRPLAAAWDMDVNVVNQNSSQKGLVYYGDANAAIGVGVIGDQVEYWVVRDNQRKVTGAVKLSTPKAAVRLRMSAGKDGKCSAYWAQGTDHWKEIGQPVDFGFLPQWDRSPRMGLNFKGAADQRAVFSAFSLNYHR